MGHGCGVATIQSFELVCLQVVILIFVYRINPVIWSLISFTISAGETSSARYTLAHLVAGSNGARATSPS